MIVGNILISIGIVASFSTANLVFLYQYSSIATFSIFSYVCQSKGYGQRLTCTRHTSFVIIYANVRVRNSIILTSHT